MDRPVKLLGPDILCRRFYAGIAFLGTAFVLGFWAAAA
jgi:hypothetical protein